MCKGLTLVTLVWLEEPCFENYVEMVAGLPRNEQKMKIFCNINKRSIVKDRTKNDYFVNQTKDRMALQTH